MSNKYLFYINQGDQGDHMWDQPHFPAELDGALTFIIV